VVVIVDVVVDVDVSGDVDESIALLAT